MKIINLIGDINKDFIKEFSELDLLKSKDKVIINICSSGGDMDISYLFYQKVKTSKAQITVHLFRSYSGASYIPLAVPYNQVIAYPGTSMLIHAPLYSVKDTIECVKQSVDYTYLLYERIFYEIYDRFLSEEEIYNCLCGKDIWLNQMEILSRLERKAKRNGKKMKGGI